MEEILASLGVDGALSAASALSGKAEDYVNDSSLEQIWAIKAMKYAETHMKLLKTNDAKFLRLTKFDDEMYEETQRLFPDLKVDVLDVDSIKSEQAKEIWRPFCNKYEKLIVDFNFASLLRVDASKDYSEDNTVIVPRIQFLAIETLRNRSGHNSILYTEK